MNALPSTELIAKVRRGILFSSPLVLAILGDRKSVTRRLDRSWLKLEVGDLLAMRETVRLVERLPGGRGDIAHYGADDSPVYRLDAWPWQRDVLPAIHMPHALTRAVLRVTEAPRLERVQDVNEEDARREGFAPGGDATARDGFRAVWHTLHTKPGQRWPDNPQVVRIAFERAS